VAAAAAAVIAVAGVAVGVWQAGEGGSSHPSAARTAASSVPAEKVPGGSGSGSAAAANPQPSSERVPAPVTPSVGISLGSFQDRAGLVAALRDQVNSVNNGVQLSSPAPSKAPPAGPGAPSTCLSGAATDARVPAGTSPLLNATLTYRDSPALVYVFQVGSAHTAVVVGVPGCGLLTLATF
jgi:hypothetical protein